MKILVSMVLVALCGLWGHMYASRFLKKRVLIENLITSLQMLKGEISYSLTPLEYAFCKISTWGEDEVSNFFKKLGENLPKNEKTISQMFESELQKGSLNILGESEKSYIRNFSHKLGKQNEENEIDNIENTVKKLEQSLVLAKAEENKNVKLYGSLGFILGGLLAIILI